MIKNSFKIVILGIIAFALLVYLTAPKNPNNIVVNENKNVFKYRLYSKIF